MEHSEIFNQLAQPMLQWDFPISSQFAPLGAFEITTGELIVSSQFPKACRKCSEKMPQSICNACGKNPSNAIKINSGLGNGIFELYALGDENSFPERPHSLMIAFDQCVNFSSESFANSFPTTKVLPVVVGTFDIDSFYRNYPSVFVGDRNIAIDGASFSTNSWVPLGFTTDILPPDSKALIYVIAWIGYLHDPSVHFLFNAKVSEVYKHDTGNNMDGQLGVIACNIVPEELLQGFIEKYKKNKHELEQFTSLATNKREFALAGGVYLKGSDTADLLAKLSSTDSRGELAELNQEYWKSWPKHWFVGHSWKNQLEYQELGSKLIELTLDSAKKVGGPSDLIAMADSLRLRGQMKAWAEMVKGIESQYANKLSDQDKMMIEAMKLTPAGHPIGSWSFNSD